MSEESDKQTFTLAEVKHLLLLFREGMVTQAEERLGTVGAMAWAKGMDQYLGAFGAYLDAIATDLLNEKKDK